MSRVTTNPPAAELVTETAEVPQSFTHKTDRDEVLLTTWRRRGRDAFTVGARWPGAHGFYRTRYGLLDPLLFGETVRQTLPLLSHAAYQVPLGHHLLWQDFRWDLDAEALRADGTGPVDIELRVACPDVTYRKSRAASLSLEVEALRDGAPLGTARTRFTIQDPAVYRRLRGPYADAAGSGPRALPPPKPPQYVGRDAFDDVVLSCTSTPRMWQLRADTAHPVLFDHPVDHVPGMLLLEGARQAAMATAHPRPVIPVSMDIGFVRYVELDAPCLLRARPLPAAPGESARVRVEAEQHDDTLFSAVVGLAEVPLR
ncbi:ScbA/BarX family gamma-butyrolactone biosynthesis protein [Streptomyces sp. NPDC059534]|uniref:ScbA/BarX family gamma-butyrolactone biosynthesis protein n=1 Tax=Streptomyces sp. NPDC059534 TaxID=3346859 RepID=UPI0036ADF6CF